MAEPEPLPAPSAVTMSFNAEAHSWILIEENAGPTPPPSPTPRRISDTHSDETDPTPSPGEAALETCHLASSENASPAADGSRGSSSDDEDDETISALAMSELLTFSWPLPLSRDSPTSALRDGMVVAAEEVHTTTADEPADKFAQFTPLAEASDGPKKSDMSGLSVHSNIEPPPVAAFSEEAEIEPSKELLRRSGWRPPLTVITVLIASHTAALLIGIMLGRQQNAVIAEQGAILARRFSSGADGMHARLCLA